MGSIIGEIIPLAVGKSISPLLIVAEILLLTGPQGRKNGWAYVLGWFAGTIVFGVVVLLVAGATDVGEKGTSSTLVDGVKLAFGVLFLSWFTWAAWRV
jgi:threonine/homoserine/homoserine lactone efflux protein